MSFPPPTFPSPRASFFPVERSLLLDASSATSVHSPRWGLEAKTIFQFLPFCPLPKKSVKRRRRRSV